MWQAMNWEMTGSSRERQSAAAEQAQLTHLRRQVDARWRTLALANERGASTDALERLYDAYMSAVDAYVTCQRAFTPSPSALDREQYAS
ncbi:MAG TPA: hypothetical protein VE338_09440 [Ktedonobacterales bacterium]|jgi:hypothetical protein|nr:hypothetical protein [Ktedonobacterales bacterium]